MSKHLGTLIAVGVLPGPPLGPSPLPRLPPPLPQPPWPTWRRP